MTVTTQINYRDPYRALTFSYYCDVCQEVAQVRCLCCGKTFCLLHGSSSKYCMECEDHLKFWGRSITFAVGFAITVPSLLFAMNRQIDFSVIAILLALAVVLFGLLTGAVRWMVLNKIRVCSPDMDVILEGVEISIAAQTKEDDRGLKVRRRGTGHSAGALPSVPMYQRTYSVG